MWYLYTPDESGANEFCVDADASVHATGGNEMERVPSLNIVVRSSHWGSVALIDATTAGYKRGWRRKNLHEAQTLCSYYQYSVPSLLTALSSSRKRESDIVSNMASEFSKGKTLVVLAIVIGCFAILWPKIFYPMFQASVAPTTLQQQPIKEPAGLYKSFYLFTQSFDWDWYFRDETVDEVTSPKFNNNRRDL